MKQKSKNVTNEEEWRYKTEAYIRLQASVSTIRALQSTNSCKARIIRICKNNPAWRMPNTKCHF